jgi:Ca2+-binding RTX toxin-like protein
LIADLARLEKLIALLEPMNGVPFVEPPAEPGKQGVVTGTREFIPVEPRPQSGAVGVGGVIDVALEVYVPISQAQLDLLEQSYTALLDSVYDGLLLQTRLKPYLDAITLDIGEDGLSFDTSGMERLFIERGDSYPVEAIRELSDLVRVGKTLLSAIEWDYIPLLSNLADKISSADLAACAQEGMIFTVASGKFDGDSEDNIILGQEEADSLGGGNGNDVLIGGKGNDTLDDGYGNDTYVLRKGSGQDVINNYDYGSGTIDTIRFGDVKSDALTGLYRSGNDLVVTYGDSDSVTIRNHFYSVYYQVERFVFADGETRSSTELLEGSLLTLSSGDDSVSFGNENDRIDALAGNDSIHGGNGNDIIYGRAGEDTLYGDNGEDILDGGLDNDTLDGGYGSDTYILRKGSGQDVINNYDYDSATTDTIRFEDVKSDALTGIERSGNDLVIFYGDSDSVTIRNHFYSVYYQVERFVFSDGVTLSASELYARPVQETPKDDETLTDIDNSEVVGENALSQEDSGADSDGSSGGEDQEIIFTDTEDTLALDVPGTAGAEEEEAPQTFALDGALPTDALLDDDAAASGETAAGETDDSADHEATTLQVVGVDDEVAPQDYGV